MGSKASFTIGVFVAIVLLISSHGVEARNLAETTTNQLKNAEKTKEKSSPVNGYGYCPYGGCPMPPVHSKPQPYRPPPPQLY